MSYSKGCSACRASSMRGTVRVNDEDQDQGNCGWEIPSSPDRIAHRSSASRSFLLAPQRTRGCGGSTWTPPTRRAQGPAVMRKGKNCEYGKRVGNPAGCRPTNHPPDRELKLDLSLIHISEPTRRTPIS